MTVVVTGASGMLGGAVYRELMSRGRDVEGWSLRTREAPDGVQFRPLDLSRPGLAEWAVEEVVPELIIHCAAMTNADEIEDRPHMAEQINAVLPGRLAEVARDAGSRFIYVSTDAVYDGEQGGLRRENEQPRPLSVYAKTKLEGEGRVLAAYEDALVVRTTMFGWTLPGKRKKFAEEILGGLYNRRPLKLFGDAMFSPLHVGDLANALLSLADTTTRGVINVGSRKPISKADFGRLIAETFGMDSSVIEERSVHDAGLRAARARNTGLDVRWFSAAVAPPPTVQEGVRRLYREAFDGTTKRLKGAGTLTYS